MIDAPPERNRRILVVDDNPDIHQDFAKILRSSDRVESPTLNALEEACFDDEVAPARSEGFELASAYQGREALAKVERALIDRLPFALAFVDMRMPPGWDGVETIAQLWSVDPRLQVVICTAFSDYSWEEIVAQLGSRENLVVLKKPFDNIEVLQLAEALTMKWCMARQLHLAKASCGEISAKPEPPG